MLLKMLCLPRVLRHGIDLNKVFCYRSLYSRNSLGIDNYLDTRMKIKQYVNDGEKFRVKMNDFVHDEKNSMVFTEDLKHMIHLAESNENDLELVEKMIRKFNQQSKETRFGNFIFGPIVMRLFFHLKNSDLALKLFKDPEMNGFFDQLTSNQILVDMLYEHGRHQDVIDVFEIIRSRQIQGGMYPRHVIVLIFASCYKENTPESYKYASKLWTELNSIGHIPMRRAVTFAAALALKQNDPHIALEMVGTVYKQHYVTVRNIKVLALAQLNRADDAIPILKSVLETNDPMATKHTFTEDVISQLKIVINESNNSELIQSYNKIEKFLIENGHISDDTLEDLLTSEIDTRITQNGLRKDQGVLAASYNKNRYDSRNDRSQQYGYKTPQYRRPGLKDMN